MGKLNYKWWFSIVVLVYQRVNEYTFSQMLMAYVAYQILMVESP